MTQHHATSGAITRPCESGFSWFHLVNTIKFVCARYESTSTPNVPLLMFHPLSCLIMGAAGLEEEDRYTGAGREAEPAAVHDGMEGLDTQAARLRFGKDLRLLEVSPPAVRPAFVDLERRRRGCFLPVHKQSMARAEVDGT